jgi:hypothetical protein
VDVVEWSRALDVRLCEWCCSVSQEIKYIIQTSRSKWQPYNISVPLDLKVTKNTRLILNIIYVWKVNQIVLELDFRAVNFFFFPRRDLNPHHWYTTIILYNILKIAELDCCQIIILSTYVPSAHAYAHALRVSLDLPYEKR